MQVVKHYHRHSANACCNALAGLLRASIKQRQRFGRLLNRLDGPRHHFGFSCHAAVTCGEAYEASLWNGSCKAIKKSHPKAAFVMSIQKSPEAVEYFNLCIAFKVLRRPELHRQAFQCVQLLGLNHCASHRYLSLQKP